MRNYPRNTHEPDLYRASGLQCRATHRIGQGGSGVVLDEKKVRRIAAHAYDLSVKGITGLLLEAKRRGLIETVKPYLDGMIRGGYFLGPKLVCF